MVRTCIGDNLEGVRFESVKTREQLHLLSATSRVMTAVFPIINNSLKNQAENPLSGCAQGFIQRFPGKNVA